MRSRASRLVVMLAAGALLLAGAPASADDLDNRRTVKRGQLDAAQSQQARLAEELEGLEGQVAATGQRLIELHAQLPAAQAAVDSAGAEVTRTQREAELIAARLAAAQQQESDLSAVIEADTARAAALRAAIAQMGREAYRGGPQLSGLDVMLDATSTEDFVTSYSQRSAALRVQTQTLEELDTLAANNMAARNRLTAVESKITELKAAADQKVAEAEAAKRAADEAKAALDALAAQVAGEQVALRAQQADIEAQLAAAEAAARQLEAELAALVAEQRAAGRPQTSVTVSGAVLSNPTVHRPMVVTSSFGMRLQPVLQIYRMHSGIDLRSYCGQPVYAARAGTVRWATFRSGYGNQVMVDHGWINGSSLMTSYAHLTRAVVGPGQQVTTGQLIGYAGATGGVSTACHLHLEVHVDGIAVNPRPYLGL
ncbi:MAG: M23 family metallopeptidase [Micrococcales bacterium]|nr:M23 family metallopeptidase [Micrococcales bacterium]